MPTNSTCDLKNPAWESNQGEINDKNQLPITNIKYGPMGYELAKVKIVVGPIVCQPSENTLLIREQMVADHIEKLKDFDRVIENETENLKTKVNENFEIVTNQTEVLKDFDRVIKDENENLKTNITKNSEMLIAATLPIGTIMPWVNRPHLTSSKRKSEIPDGWQR